MMTGQGGMDERSAGVRAPLAVCLCTCLNTILQMPALRFQLLCTDFLLLVTLSCVCVQTPPDEKSAKWKALNEALSDRARAMEEAAEALFKAK